MGTARLLPGWKVGARSGAGLLLVSLLLLPVLPSCDGATDKLEEEARVRRLEELGVGSFDPEGGAPLAGISARRRVRLEPLDRDEIGADTASREFREFLHRCSACHEPPAPSQHTAREWEVVVRRMAARADSAGLLPFRAAERGAILRFLKRHAGE